VTAAAIGSVGLISLAVVSIQLLEFGRLMHRIIEAVAKQVRLLPVEPVPRKPLLVQRPHAV